MRMRLAPGFVAALGVAAASACAYGGPRSPAPHTSVAAKRTSLKGSPTSAGDTVPKRSPPQATPEAEGDKPAESFREPVTDKLEASAPAVRFADMSPDECLREVDRGAIALTHDKKASSGVTTPMRITGPLHGVKFVVPGASSKFGVLDCRLGLALDELAGSLAEHRVVAVHIDNFYRPNAKLPGKAKSSQHAFGLAADITSIELDDGRTLTPVEDWRADIGDKPCGPDAVMSSDGARAGDATMLRNVVCDVARKGLFHDVLTPSFNAAHRSHFHFDIKHNTARQALR